MLNKGTIEVGGGTFNAQDVHRDIRAMMDALNNARVICAMIQNGQEDMQKEIDDFYINLESAGLHKELT